jgi:hypothetical protein
MAVVRLIAVALFVCALCGCQSFMKNDPIMGDHPWQPGTGTAPNRTSSSTTSGSQ